eukprot:gene12233-8419_t
MKRSDGEDDGIETTFDFWQDREIRFDGPTSTVDLRGREEVAIRILPRVEDTKGNNGLVGTLIITNLRLIWYASTKQQTNLSIGYFTVRNITVKEADSKLGGGIVSSLYVTAKFGSSKFQFVFTAAGNNGGTGSAGRRAAAARTGNAGDHLFSLAHMAWKAYEATKMYREVRLRSAILTGGASGQLVLLKKEKVMSQYNRFLNITKEESFVGRLILTNVRVVWIEDVRPSFNVSVPYIQIVGLRLQTSSASVAKKTKKAGEAKGKDGVSKTFEHLEIHKTIVLQCSSYGGNFKFGFSALQPELTRNIFAEVRSLWQLGLANPVLGVEVEALDTGAPATQNGPPEGDPSRSSTTNSSTLRHGPGGFCSVAPSVPSSRGPNSAGGPSASIVAEGANEQVFEEAPRDSFAAYYADEETNIEPGEAKDGGAEEAGGADRRHKGRPPVYDVGLGLAVEKLRKGMNMRDLWKSAGLTLVGNQIQRDHITATPTLFIIFSHTCQEEEVGHLFLYSGTDPLCSPIPQFFPFNTTSLDPSAMQIISKHRHRFLSIAMWGGAVSTVMFWLVLRRAGFNTSYSRCTYLVMLGEYKQLLEPGMSPNNPYLPPHLRLDQRSYLDHPETELAVPPTLDLQLNDRQVVQGTEESIPRMERSDLHVRFGPFKAQTIVMSSSSNERYVRRRLPVSEEDQRRKMEEERIREAISAASRGEKN